MLTVDIPVEVLVTSLGHSQKIYAQACPDQTRKNYMNECKNALRYYGRAPKALVPDNLESAVTVASKYEPEINDIYRELANHYGMYVYPSRSRTPQDKFLVEKGVNIVYNRIYVPIRDRNFFSIDELNVTIRYLPDPLNEVNFLGKLTTHNI